MNMTGKVRLPLIAAWHNANRAGRITRLERLT